MRLLLIVLFLGACAVTGGSAKGGTKLIKPDDPAGDEMRAVGRDFLAAIAASDAAAARRLFAGSPEAGESIDAAIQASNSIQAFSKVSRDRFQIDRLTAWLGNNLYGTLSQGISRRWMALNGDCAVLAPDGQRWRFDFDLVLARREGRWMIVAFSASSGMARAKLKYQRAFADKLDQLRTKVEMGETKSKEEFSKQLGTAMRNLDEVFNTEVNQPCGPTEKAVPLKIPADELTRLIGKDIFAPDVVRFMDRLAGVPILSSVSAGEELVVASPACGIEVWIDFAKGLSGFTLHVRPEGVDNAYTGGLPFDIRADDRRADVEHKLGVPAESTGVTCYSASYPERGLRIDYADGGTRDPEVRIKSIWLLARRPNTKSRPQTTPRLAFRLVSADPADPAGETLKDPMDKTGQLTVSVLKQVLLDETSVAEVYPVLDTKGRRLAEASGAIGLTMTTEGAHRLKQITGNNIGRRIALVLDGEILTAPMIRSEISERVIISSGDTDIDGTCGRLHATVNVLPSTRPSQPK